MTLLLVYLVLSVLSTPGAAAGLRYMFYFTKDHLATLPGTTETRLSTHAILAGEHPNNFIEKTTEISHPIIPLATVRSLFDQPIKVCLSVGGQEDLNDFWEAAANETVRQQFAQNLHKSLDAHGYDCAELSFSSSHGQSQHDTPSPRSIQSHGADDLVELLAKVKGFDENKELSIVVPGREQDMTHFDRKTMIKINKIVDHVTVKSYDFVDLRDEVSNHSSGFRAVGDALKRYLDLGVPSIKLDMGFSYYATWRRSKPGSLCLAPTICPLLQGSNDIGIVTFEKENFEPNPPNLDPVIAASFQEAMREGHIDLELGGWWYWDMKNSLFWSWDTADTIYNKCLTYVPGLGIGGLASYAAPMDSGNWRRMVMTASGVAWIPGEFFEELEAQLASQEVTHEEL